MKKLTLFFCAVLFTSGITFAQQKKSLKKSKIVANKTAAPTVVNDAFKQNFEATDANWTKTSSGHWIAKFVKDEVKTSAEYDKDGSWVATRSQYEADKLPETVTATIKTKYPDATIKDGWKIERADIAAYYKVNIQENGAEKAVLINETGTITE